MTNYRMFLLSFVAVSCIFLSGFKKTVDKSLSVGESTQILAQASSEKAVNSAKPKAKKMAEKIVLQKYLDLSIPFEHSNMTDTKIEQGTESQNQENNLFAPETKKKPQALQVQGSWLISQEPEAEKRKSVDGAGITINLKP